MFRILRNRFVLSILAGGAFLICAAIAVAAFRPNEISAVEDAVKAVLKDPASAQFRNIKRAVGIDGAYCGQVNARNSYNGYTGFHSFVFTARKRVIVANKHATGKEIDYQLEMLEYFKGSSGACENYLD